MFGLNKKRAQAEVGSDAVEVAPTPQYVPPASLRLHDQTSFQDILGYHDDPDPMSCEQVACEIGRWAEELSVAAQDGSGASSDTLADAGAFLRAIAEGDIALSDPLPEYRYIGAVEYARSFTIAAPDAHIADEIAARRMASMQPPASIPGVGELSMVYADQDFGSNDRVYESFGTTADGPAE